jgi:hypothetical protein
MVSNSNSANLHRQLLALIDKGASEDALALLFTPELDTRRLAILSQFTHAVAHHPDLGTDRVKDRIQVVDVALNIERGSLLRARSRARSLTRYFAQRRDYAQFHSRRLDLNRAYDLNRAQNQVMAMSRLFAYARFLVVALDRSIATS